MGRDNVELIRPFSRPSPGDAYSVVIGRAGMPQIRTGTGRHSFPVTGSIPSHTPPAADAPLPWYVRGLGRCSPSWFLLMVSPLVPPMVAMVDDTPTLPPP